jgi:hypothetical protein
MAYSGFANLETTDTFSTWYYRTNQLLHFLSNQIVTTDSSAAGANTDGNTHINGYLSANVVSVTETLYGGTNDAHANLSIGSNTTFSSSDVTVEGTTTLAVTNIDGTLTVSVPSYFDNILPNPGNSDIGNTTSRWDAYINNLDVSGTTDLNGVLTVAAQSNMQDIIPSTDSYDLGNTSSRWDGFFNSIDIVDGGSIKSAGSTVTVDDDLDCTGTISAPVLTSGNIKIVGNTANVTSTSSTIVDEFDSTESQAFKYLVGVTTGDPEDSYIVEMLVTHNSNNVYYTRYGEISVGTSNTGPLVELSADFNGSNIALSATCSNADVSNTHTINFARFEII